MTSIRQYIDLVESAGRVSAGIRFGAVEGATSSLWTPRLIGAKVGPMNEMTATTAGVKVLYHGTPTTRAAEAILRAGVLEPGQPQGKGRLAAVAGMVFLTPDLPYAIKFATGKTPGAGVFPDAEEPFGYVFEASPTTGATVQPDEDSVGLFVQQHVVSTAEGFSYRRPNINRFDQPEVGAAASDEEHIEMLRWLRQSVPDSKLWDRVGWFDAAKEIGKRALRKMTPERRQTFIEWGAHIAHHGPVSIGACWKIEKALNGRISHDATNFFALAERVR